ncbi:MAG: threonylcarbamoyl-AMP synthase [Bacteroidia bacterium]|nr:threonylcarbamoyl-AMP synthase [Bacteroidia bacterium]
MITKDIHKAKTVLLKNDIIAIPTETVYGLAGNAYEEEALKKIYLLKKRPLNNPLIVHIHSLEQLHDVAEEIPEMALHLAKTFWPGPLTLILKKRANIPYIVTSGKETVAVRMPGHQLTLDLLQQLDFPLAAPSANPYGSISPTSAAHVEHYFKEQLEVILDGGECERGVESTIIGFLNDQPILYRHGSIALEEIENNIGRVQIQNHSTDQPEAPGMQKRHYAPNTESYLTNNIEDLIRTLPYKKLGVLSFKNSIQHENVIHQIILSKNGDYSEAAKNLFSALHQLDQLNLDAIIAERLPNEDLGRTINDRLERAIQKNPEE